MAGPVIATKLYVPKLGRGLVARPRLSERLRRGAESRLTLLSAPAGFGKTTLLAEWLEETPNEDRCLAWISLDAADSEPASFWTYVVTALQTAVPGVGSAALELIASAPCGPTFSTIRRNRQDALLFAWLKELPDDAVRRSPALSVFSGFMHMVSGDLEGVEPRLDDAQKALATVPDGSAPPWADTDELRAFPATIAVYWASLAQARGDVVGTVEHARHAPDTAGPNDHLSRGSAAGFLGLAAWSKGDVTTALQTQYSKGDYGTAGSQGGLPEPLGGNARESGRYARADLGDAGTVPGRTAESEIGQYAEGDYGAVGWWTSP